MSLVDDSPVSEKGVLVMLAYLVAFCLFLVYCLLTFWPNAPALVISSIAPNPAAPGDAVTIGGSGFTNGMTVSFDDAAGTVDKIEGTSLTVKLPKHAQGQARMIVKDTNGQAVVIPNGFVFTAEKPAGAPAGQSAAGPSAPPNPAEAGAKPAKPAAGAGAAATGEKAGAAGAKAGAQTPAAAGAGAAATGEKASAPAAKAGAQGPGAPAPNAPGGTSPNTEATKETAAKAPSAWPNVYRSNEASNEDKVDFLFFKPSIRDNVRVLIIVMIVGALGSLIHVFRSFYWYAGNRTLKTSWLLMYIMLPFNGAGMAVLFYTAAHK